MPAFSNPTTCCSIVCVVPQATTLAISNAAQPMQMVWMTPVNSLSVPGQFVTDANVPVYDVSGAASLSWPAEQAQSSQLFAPNSSWVSSEHAPQQLPMGGQGEHPSQQIFVQVPADMVAWQAPQVELARMQDYNAYCEPNTAEQALQEVPQQVNMEMTQTLLHEEKEAEEEHSHSPAQFDGEADSSFVVGKSTLRRRCRQQAQLHFAPASKDDGHSAADADVADHEETEADADAAQAHEMADKILEQLWAGEHERQAAIASMERMAFRSKMSCRAAQLALEKASSNDAAALAWGMRGHVRSAVQSRFANYVIQKILETLPVSRSGFVVEELLGFGAVAARHRFGCRILCRILEHWSLAEGALVQLLEEILDSGAEELCKHEFGSYVVRHLLEYGLPEHRQKIASALRIDVMGYSTHRYGSHVVEAALKHCSAQDQHMLARQLLVKQDALLSLASSQFGHHVVRALLRLPAGEARQQAVDAIRPLALQLQNLKYGKRLLQALNSIK